MLTGRSFFPQLISEPFKHGLVLILAFAAVMSLIAAGASALRGKRFVHEEAGSTIGRSPGTAQLRPAAGEAAPSDGKAVGNGGGLRGRPLRAGEQDRRRQRRRSRAQGREA